MKYCIRTMTLLISLIIIGCKGIEVQYGKSSLDSHPVDSDGDMLTDPAKNAYRLFFGQDRVFRAADRLLEDGEILTLGAESVRVMNTPGHSIGSSCFVTDDFIVTGDTIFAEGYGRTDLYGGNMQQLVSSLRALAKLSHDLVIYPGHGDSATLGDALSKLGL